MEQQLSLETNQDSDGSLQKNRESFYKLILPIPRFPFIPTMVAPISKLVESIRRLSRNDATLATLDLRSNKVGDIGARLLAEALAINSTLTTLDLYKNQVGAAGAGRLAEALAVNSTLTILNLYSNKIEAEGAERLGEALSTSRITRWEQQEVGGWHFVHGNEDEGAR